MIVSCHQPNFFPWNPFFEKVEAADIFVLLEHVQYTRHQFQNRFQFENKWMTMPVQNGELSDLIKEKKYVEPQKSWGKIKAKINNSILDKFDHLISESLAETNISIIELIASDLKIQTRIHLDSKDTELNPSRKLLNICLKYKATEYLAGPSGRKYLDEKVFHDHDIKVSYFEAREKSSIIERICG